MEFLSNATMPPLPDGPPDEIYYKIENFLAMFYMVRPSRTMYKNIEDVPNFFNMVIRIGPIVFAIEYILLWLQGKPTYRWNDTIIGMGALLTCAIPLSFVEAGWFTLYNWIWENYRLVDLPYDSMWVWLFCLPALELSNYCAHRAAHEINILWAQHQMHHTSEELTLPAGIRFSFNEKFIIGLNCMPWALLLPPGPAKAHHSLNLVYQLWVHTESIGNLGPIEWVCSTPTQHVIHHGVNRFCIDKNYSGFLNIWDQIFGTMVWPTHHKGKKVYFGLLNQVKTWDFFYIYTNPYRELYRRVNKYDNFADKMSALFKGPGWEPGKPRLGNREEIPEEPIDKTFYNKTSPWYIYIYCALHMLIVWHLSTTVVAAFWTMPTYLQVVATAFVTWSVCSLGYVLEHKYYAPALEWTRCALFFVIEIILADGVYSQLPDWLLTTIRGACALSLVIWTFNFNLFSPKMIKEE